MMKKFFSSISIIALVLLSACSTESGEFLVWDMDGFSLIPEETYYFVGKIEWTGEEPAEIESIELIKENGDSITYENDQIDYEFFGADSLKQVGIYFGDADVGDIKNLNGMEIDGEGRIVLKVILGEVKEDDGRKMKINFKVDGEKREEILDWHLVKRLSTTSD